MKSESFALGGMPACPSARIFQTYPSHFSFWYHRREPDASQDIGICLAIDSLIQISQTVPPVATTVAPSLRNGMSPPSPSLPLP
mmetsp:Transcript_36381/g.88118  ORF Transcript_36381/g.88118 Transcript_36381/m.88118 type:complete len:84 (+) Transcript_36381:1418-1669(+)